MILKQICQGLDINQRVVVPDCEELQAILNQNADTETFHSEGTAVNSDLWLEGPTNYDNAEPIGKIRLQLVSMSMPGRHQFLIYKDLWKKDGTVHILRIERDLPGQREHHLPINNEADFAHWLKTLWGRMDRSVTFPGASNALRHFLP